MDHIYARDVPAQAYDESLKEAGNYLHKEIISAQDPDRKCNITDGIIPEGMIITVLTKEKRFAACHLTEAELIFYHKEYDRRDERYGEDYFIKAALVFYAQKNLPEKIAAQWNHEPVEKREIRHYIESHGIFCPDEVAERDIQGIISGIEMPYEGSRDRHQGSDHKYPSVLQFDIL